jgi:hypothetical protein
MNRRQIIIIAIVAIIVCCVIVVLAAMIYNATPSGQATVTAREEAQLTEEAKPTDTVEASETPEPTEPPEPTNTPEPTDTPQPTDTPAPTFTPTIAPSPTPLPDPIVLTGTGDSVVDFDNPFSVAIVHVTGNAASRYFGVTTYDANGNQIDLLVNTTDPYDGVRPLDFRDDEHTTRFEVSADGDWVIEIKHLFEARKLDVPGTITGSGDDVFLLLGAAPDTATIIGNAEGRYFGVFAYGEEIDLLVNTTDPYEGTVIVDPNTLVIEVKAEGEWEITVE